MSIPRVQSRMEWQSTLAAMKRHGTRVIRTCSTPCTFHEPVDLDAMTALLGEDGDLWDQRPPCPVCDRRNHFMCSPGPGTPYRPMVSRDRRPEAPRPPEGWPAWPPSKDEPMDHEITTPLLTGFTRREREALDRFIESRPDKPSPARAVRLLVVDALVGMGDLKLGAKNRGPGARRGS